jgi:alpha-glucosidase
MDMSVVPWWRGAVIYQIYPRSFKDTNGDGVGDLSGIIEKLDYIASLGIDAIWIAPFFKSPMKDFGYDVSDYRKVDPLFGTMEDFEHLLRRAHDLGLKVMIDQVLSHTSSEHEWFCESRQSRDNEKSEWYVWADAKADGSPPNNWLSIFGGIAWTWEPRRRQYYLHNFLSSQPDLNFHNPAVRRAVLENVKFWLDKGVDGFRLDAINFCFHDSLLRDNPPKPAERRTGRGFTADNPYAYQYHYYNNTQPENLGFLEELRALFDRYPDAASLGEIASEDSLATMAEYTSANRLHMGYSFELLTETFSVSHIRHTVEQLESRIEEGWPCWALSNHDVSRVLTRWGGADAPRQLANLLTGLLCCLRGSVCIYQGEELGLTEASIPYHSLQDPYGVAFWPTFKGRDGCRTPIPWTDADAAGFTDVKPWLPVPDDHRFLSVNKQDPDRNSVLNAFRAFLRWRQAWISLRVGDIQFIDIDDRVLAFTRSHDDETMIVVFNLSSQSVTTSLPGSHAYRPVEAPGLGLGKVEGRSLRLPAYGAWFASIS